MAEKRKSPSIRALEELHQLVKEKCHSAHGYEQSYRGSDSYVDSTTESKNLAEAKHKVIEKISKEIEEYAVKTYTKYGVIVVPLCHRKDTSGDDRLEIDLKVKSFPEVTKEIAAKEKADAAYKADIKKVEEWYFKALQAVALKEELPKVPEFKEN